MGHENVNNKMVQEIEKFSSVLYCSLNLNSKAGGHDVFVAVVVKSLLFSLMC